MGFLDLIYPKKCLECGKEGVYICNNCLSVVGKSSLFCLECKKPSLNGMTHISCRKKCSIDFAYSLWNYEGVVRRAILKLKYNFAYNIADELSEKFVERLVNDINLFPKEAGFTPVPLHRMRKNWRGFNQSEILGESISLKMGWKFDPDILERKNASTPQTELKGKERQKNLLGAFNLNPNHKLLSTNYILFDDVLTTGSTLKEAAKVLKRNGVRKVWGLTIAS